MIINHSFTVRFCSVLCALFVATGSAISKESKAITNEKIRRQALHKAWLDKKLTNDAYYLAVDAPTVSGCQSSIIRTQKVMKLYGSKLRKAKTARTKKKYSGALKAYKVYGETMVEILKAFQAKESGRVSTEFFPIIRKCERRIVLFTGRSVKRSYFFTPEVYPEYFKSKSEKEEDTKADKSDEKADSKKSDEKKK